MPKKGGKGGAQAPSSAGGYCESSYPVSAALGNPCLCCELLLQHPSQFLMAKWVGKDRLGGWAVSRRADLLCTRTC